MNKTLETVHIYKKQVHLTSLAISLAIEHLKKAFQEKWENSYIVREFYNKVWLEKSDSYAYKVGKIKSYLKGMVEFIVKNFKYPSYIEEYTISYIEQYPIKNLRVRLQVPDDLWSIIIPHYIFTIDILDTIIKEYCDEVYCADSKYDLLTVPLFYHIAFFMDKVEVEVFWQLILNVLYTFNLECFDIE